jgi:hypothetical protein
MDSHIIVSGWNKLIYIWFSLVLVWKCWYIGLVQFWRHAIWFRLSEDRYILNNAHCCILVLLIIELHIYGYNSLHINSKYFKVFYWLVFKSCSVFFKKKVALCFHDCYFLGSQITTLWCRNHKCGAKEDRRDRIVITEKKLDRRSNRSSYRFTGSSLQPIVHYLCI